MIGLEAVGANNRTLQAVVPSTILVIVERPALSADTWGHPPLRQKEPPGGRRTGRTGSARARGRCPMCRRVEAVDTLVTLCGPWTISLGSVASKVLLGSWLTPRPGKCLRQISGGPCVKARFPSTRLCSRQSMVSAAGAHHGRASGPLSRDFPDPGAEAMQIAPANRPKSQ